MNTQKQRQQILDWVQQVFANYGIINDIPEMIVSNIDEGYLQSFLHELPNNPNACLSSLFPWSQSKEGGNYWTNYARYLLSLCDVKHFYSCKPPYRGWWYTKVDDGFGYWRWWDGQSWSVGYNSTHNFRSNEVVFPCEPNKIKCQWSFYYPENARVPRINQDWEGFKGLEAFKKTIGENNE